MPVESPIAQNLLDWYDVHARDLPWRRSRDPYWIWLSEVMLQQTTVAAAAPYFERFTARWPSVEALAAAQDDDLMSAWAGLGYYARARNLLACARAVTAGGGFPESEAGLRTLPGIGRYTAAAIAAIAFGKRAVVVDGNVERVVARLFAVDKPVPAARPELYRLTDSITPDARAGDFAQAIMDLGATICTPRKPRCLLCPLRESCKAAESGTPEAWPARAAKIVRPTRTETAYWLECDGDVLLVRRPPKGLLGGMRALPVGAPPLGGDWRVVGVVSHVFTHFALTLTVETLLLENHCKPQLAGEWWPIERLDEAGLPTLFVKAARRAREGL